VLDRRGVVYYEGLLDNSMALDDISGFINLTICSGLLYGQHKPTSEDFCVHRNLLSSTTSNAPRSIRPRRSFSRAAVILGEVARGSFLSTISVTNVANGALSVPEMTEWTNDKRISAASGSAAVAHYDEQQVSQTESHVAKQ
jgi:hypothetical protein